jgi:hypothetical protein
MKLSTVAMFGAGYVLGTRAGRQRYEQLCGVARRVAGEFDATSIRSGLETMTTRLEQYAGTQDTAAGGNGSSARGQARR